MISPSRGRGRLLVKTIVSTLGVWVIVGSTLPAFGDGPACGVANCRGAAGHTHIADAGTLGYGPPGYYPGFQGFGLGYHLGYGYGGKALGVGAGGGYPFYGGPGYPHCPPPLNRFHRDSPFAYFGGPGYPTPGHPYFYGPTGPLVVEKPVIEVGLESGGYDVYSGFGSFTGVLPYPESTFAPFTTAVSNATYGVIAPPSAPPAANPSAPAPSSR